MKNIEICSWDGESVLPNQWMSKRKIDQRAFFIALIRARAQHILEQAQSIRDNEEPRQRVHGQDVGIFEDFFRVGCHLKQSMNEVAAENESGVDRTKTS